MKAVKVAVVGAGVIGLSTAVRLSEALQNSSVTILSEKFSPDTTSDGAAGILLPEVFPDIPLDRQRRWFKETFDHLQGIIESPEAPEAGVFLSSGYHIFKEVPSDPKPLWSEYVFGFRFMTDREMKRFPNHKFGQAFTSLKCECPRYLPWLEKRFRGAGGQIKREKVTDLQQLTSTYDVIVNCSGVWAHHLAGDKGVYPVRGQILKLRATWLKNFIRDGDGKTYIYPGIDYVTIGGTRQKDDWRLELDKGDSEDMMKQCSQLEPSLQKAEVLEEWVGLRPGRKNPRIESEWLQAGDRQVLLVHNYGHGGCGITLSWGSALDALELVRNGLQKKPPIEKIF
ncbi:D-aspartate oxidase-like [Salminus brasiliensis]|uniref:D-aspartate oxidase-like n=1 Tax=Salminus brasiliensis TaxID=930266 RepID=UPI003B833BF0